MTQHFISIKDLDKSSLEKLIDQSAKLKADLKSGKDQRNILANKSLGMIFEKPSLRTRISFEVGMKQLGGNTVVLSKNEIQMGSRESIADISKVFSRYLDAVMIRTFGQNIIEELTQHSSIPIINGLSDYEHPCQTLADLLTIKEHFGSFDGLKVAYIGDGNNTVRSLMLAAKLLGLQIHVACPVGFEPGKEFESEHSTVCHSVGEACEGADVVYTDVWSSMGQEKEAQERREIFKGYQVNMSLLQEFAKDRAIVLHCLPAHRGEEITAKAIDAHEETILNQAENRLHTQKAVLKYLLG